MSTAEEIKEAAIARGAFISGCIVGMLVGGIIIFLVMISMLVDINNTYRALRSEALSRGHVQYKYDQTGEPILKWDESPSPYSGTK